MPSDMNKSSSDLLGGDSATDAASEGESESLEKAKAVVRGIGALLGTREETENPAVKYAREKKQELAVLTKSVETKSNKIVELKARLA